MMYYFTHLLLIKMIIFTTPLADSNLLFNTWEVQYPPYLRLIMSAFVRLE